MKISELFKNKKALYSFEIFPPKPTADLGVVEKAISELASLAPDYISVTCSAGGSGNSRMPEIVDMLRNKYDVEPLDPTTVSTSRRLAIPNATPKALRRKRISSTSK